MPIKIPDALPAHAVLESENIFVMTEKRAMTQDIRPLRIVLLNLMPTKVGPKRRCKSKLTCFTRRAMYRKIRPRST